MKGYDGGEFLDTLSVQVSFGNPAWQEVAAMAADDEGRVFVADRGVNKVYRYEVTGGNGDLEVSADGELVWTSQAGGATVRDIAFSNGRIVLLDDGIGTIQLLDPGSGPLNPPLFDYYDELLPAPTVLSANAENLFVINSSDTTIWEIPADLAEGGELLVNTDTNAILQAPSAMTVVQGRVYVADPELGKIIDYEKRQ